MNELQQYLTNEVVADHAEGLLSRREAIRRLALMGLAVPAATALLAAPAAAAPGTPKGKPRKPESVASG